MKHTIKTKDGLFITEKNIISEIKDMMHNGLDYTYVNGKKVSVYSDLRTHEERITVIRVEV